ncbi:MAG: endonuclease/exonuclease/phosphatase family protein [Planctomycetaceae bacterium]|nr:endonuclease/exonuclease/phosphatase family protein [Planctomycetaceae bacterium]
MCYNIHHGRGMDDAVNLERTANVIKEWKPDLAALQEVDKNTQRTNQTDQAKRLGEMLGMHSAFGKAIDFQGGEYGLAILSRFPILEHQMILLPPEEQQEQRGLQIVEIAIPDPQHPDSQERRIRFANTHLSHSSQAERTAQFAKIDEILSVGNMPIILAGDFNARPADDLVVQFLKNWRDTVDLESDGKIAADRPAGRIDYIFFRTSDPFTVLESRTIDDRITSDHMPIISVLAL